MSTDTRFGNDNVIIKEVESEASRREITDLRKEISTLNKNSTAFTELTKLTDGVVKSKDLLLEKIISSESSKTNAINNMKDGLMADIVKLHNKELELCKKETEVNRKINETNLQIATTKADLELEIKKLEQDAQNRENDIDLLKKRMELENQVYRLELEKELNVTVESKYKEDIKALKDKIATLESELEEVKLQSGKDANKEYVTRENIQINLHQDYNQKIMELRKSHSDEIIGLEYKLHEIGISIDKLKLENNKLKTENAILLNKKGFVTRLFFKRG